MPTLRIAQDDAADEPLGRDPPALLLGMLFDSTCTNEAAELLSARHKSDGDAVQSPRYRVTATSTASSSSRWR